MEKKSYITSIVALVISIITIILFFVRVSPNSVVDSNTFISILVAIMTLVFSILVGYQIYNAIEINQRMKEIDFLKKELVEKEQQLRKEIQEIQKVQDCYIKEFKMGGNILQARTLALDTEYFYSAFVKMLTAIRCALDVDIKEEYESYLDELKKYMLMLNSGYPFDGSKEDVKQTVQLYRNSYKDVDEAIRKHKNYYNIKFLYEPLMREFDKRLNGIAQMKAMSETEVGKEKEV